MSNHTPEPWRVGLHSTVVSDTPVPGMSGSDAVEYYGGHLIGESIIEANARRIVACVNACSRIDTETLESEHLREWCERKRLEAVKLAEHNLNLKTQRDELLAALQGMVDIASDSQGVAGYHLNGEVADWGAFEEWQAACDAIAKAKGGAVNHFPDAGKMVVQGGWRLVADTTLRRAIVSLIDRVTNTTLSCNETAVEQIRFMNEISAPSKLEGE